LHALAADPSRWRYGYDLCTELGIRAGSMYPILIRLTDRGLLEASWEGQPEPGRPARHLYRLSAAGHAYAASVAAASAVAAAAVRAPGRATGAGLQAGGA
jgi:DNA-binding PadR family transcriptional regulator